MENTFKEWEQFGIDTAIWCIMGSSDPRDLPEGSIAKQYWGQYVVPESDIDPFIQQHFPNEDNEYVLQQMYNQLVHYTRVIHGSIGSFLRRSSNTSPAQFRLPIPIDEVEPSVLTLATNEYERIKAIYPDTHPTYEEMVEEINGIFYDPLQVLLMNVIKDKKISFSISIGSVIEYNPNISKLHNAVLGQTSYPVHIPRIECVYDIHNEEYYIRYNQSYTVEDHYDSRVRAMYDFTMDAMTQILATIIKRRNPDVRFQISPYVGRNMKYHRLEIDESVLHLNDVTFSTVKTIDQ